MDSRSLTRVFVFCFNIRRYYNVVDFLQWDVERTIDENIDNHVYIRDILTNILTHNIRDMKLNENSENIKKSAIKLYEK